MSAWRFSSAAPWPCSGDLIILVAVGSLAFYPYTKYYATAYAGLQLWQEKTTTLPDYLTVWGFFLVLAFIYLASEWVLQVRERQMPRWLDKLLPVVVAAAVVLMGVGFLLKVNVWLIAVPLFTVAVVLALARDIPAARRLALLLLALALAITMGVEVVRQKDDIGRMNTVFKFYMQAWTLFGVSDGLRVGELGCAMPVRGRRPGGVWRGR